VKTTALEKNMSMDIQHSAEGCTQGGTAMCKTQAASQDSDASTVWSGFLLS